MIDLDDVEESNEDCPFTINDLKSLAKSYIDLYFIDKVGKDGKPIPIELLHSERNVSFVLNWNICLNMPDIYNGMEGLFSNKKGKIPADVQFMIDQLSCCSRRCIPKAFATGIVAMYLEVCMGCKLNERT